MSFQPNETPSGAINGSNRTFTLDYAPYPTNNLQLYLNGDLTTQGLDYTLSGTTISWIATNPPQTGDVLRAWYPYGTIITVATPTPNSIYGSDLRNLTQAFLGGYANSLQDDVLFQLINEAKNEVWMILKDLKVDYFGTSSQNSASSAGNYFPQLNTQLRQYTLPKDFHEMRYIEVEDVGWEMTRFIYRPMSDLSFATARRASTNDNTVAQSPYWDDSYYYDIVGKNQLVMAQYPAYNFNVVLWYIRIIPDIGENDVLDEILYPYSQKIATYAAKKALLSKQDESLYAAWKDEWTAAVQRIAGSSAPRQSSDPTFVQDYNGYGME